jgi:hypothetical protein
MLIIGVILGIIASICSNFGNIQQKYAFKHEIQELDIYWKNKRWLIGFILTIIGSIFDLIALANAAQSVVGPLAAFGLISNIFFAKWMLEENINKKHILATLLIITGSTISVVFGNHTSHTYTISDLQHYFIHPIFLFYLTISIITCIYLYRQILKMNSCYEHIETSLQQIDAYMEYLPYQAIHPILICCVSGFLGGYSILFGKITSELVSSSFVLGSIQFFDIFAIYCIFMLILTIVFQQKTLAMGLKYFDIAFVIPVFQCFFILSSIFGGACFFQEFSSLSTIQLILFLIGSWITLVGVFILSLQSKTQIKLIHIELSR